MALIPVESKRPSLLRRIFGRQPAAPERAAWVEDGEWQHHDLLISQLASPEARRMSRSNADMQAVYGAVYAAIRKRVRAIAKPRIALMRRDGQENVEVEEHPVLEALDRMNGQLTWTQGLGLIEQHKMAAGKAYWIKRRDRLRTVREFEIWLPEQVTPVRDPKRPWVAAGWKRRLDDGREEIAPAEEVVWFPHMIDPRDPLNALSPIGAIRLELDTGMEAKRFNQRFFDNNTHVGQIFSAMDAGPGEVARLEKEIERKFRGTDKAFRAAVFGGEFKALETNITHKDMEFLEQQRWTVDEVARVFEIGVSLMGGGQRTFENVQHDLRDFWEMIVEENQAIVESLNRFFVQPDFGPEYFLTVTADNIPALQPDRKLQAEIDGLYLDKGVISINEVREREGMDAVNWGDVPLLDSKLAPLGTRPPAEPPRYSGRSAGYEWDWPGHPVSVRIIEADMEGGWERRLSREVEAIIRHMGGGRAIGDIDTYSWDWLGRYGAEVAEEIIITFIAALEQAGFVETPLLSVQQVAARYAQARAGELLSLSGRESVTKTTRDAVKKLAAGAIENGDSLQTMAKTLREDYAFSASRAEAIARTETTRALGEGSLKAYTSQGFEGKRWLTAGDSNVCAVCRSAEDEGVIPLGRMFNNGYAAPPPHPRCRCKLEPQAELPRSTNGAKPNGSVGAAAR